MKPRRVSISGRSKGSSRSPAQVSSVTFDPSVGEFGHTDREALPSWRKHPFAILGGIVLVAYIVGAIALQAFVDVDLVRTWVAPRASAALNRTVHIGGGTVGLFPRPSVRLSDISIDNLAGAEGPTLARIDRVRLDLAWLPLLIGRVRIRGVHVDGAALHLAIDENGRSNFGDLVPARSADADSSGASAPFAASLRQISFTDASVTYLDAPRGRSMGVTGGDAWIDVHEEGSDTQAGWRADMTLESDSLMVRMLGASGDILRTHGPTGQLSARGAGAAQDVRIDRGFLELASDTLQVRGRLSGMEEPQPSFEVELTGDHVSARTLTAILPEDVRQELLPAAEGTLAVVLRLRGGLDSSERPTLDASVRLQGVTLRLRGEPIAESVYGVVALDGERITLDSLRGAFAGGPFEMSGVVLRDERSTATVLARANPDLDVLYGLGLLPPRLTLSGDAQVDVSIAGPLDALDSLQVVGTTAVQGFQLAHDRLGVPIYVPAGSVGIAGHGIQWTALPVLVGSDRVVTSGRLDAVAGFWMDSDGLPEIEASFAGPSLDLDGLFPPRLDQQPSYAEIAFAHLSGRAVDGRDASVVAGYVGMHRVAGLPLVGTLELRFDTLSQGDRRVEAVVATVELTDSSLAVTDASFEAWGGRANGSLRVALGGARTQPFALSLRVEDAAADVFFRSVTSRSGEEASGVQGTLDLQLDLAGSIDPVLLPVAVDLQGEARVTLSNGRVTGTGVNAALSDFLESEEWMGVPFSRLAAEVAIRERVLEIRDGELEGDLARFAFSGPVRFNGEAAVSMALAVPADRLQYVSLRRTGVGAGVVEQLKRAGTPLDLGLQVTGFLSAPSLVPNAAHALGLAGR